MEGTSDAIATEDLNKATEEVERAWGEASLEGDWKTTLNDLVVKPSTQNDFLRKTNPSSQKKAEATQEDWRFKGIFFCYNKARNPVKTTPPPPPAIRIDSVHLNDRIESLQNLALIGKWHFPEMSDSDMRKWLANFGNQ